ncbi:MAG TPA: hypothetical protein VLA35_05660 [Thermoleophilia bacterium]|nr:hypothetical protein [Thermoleophilia bacterium]
MTARRTRAARRKPRPGERRPLTALSEAEKRSSLLTACAAFVAAAVVGAVSYRIGLGFDPQDEGFAVVVPWRWALGDRPFVDEMNLMQTAGFLTYPFVKAYVWVTGGSEGIVLYLRQLYVLWVGIVTGLVFFGLKGHVRWQYGAAISAVYITFVVLGASQLSSATLAAGFLTIGVALGVRVVLGGDAMGRGRRLTALAAGAAHGLAAVAAPTLLVLPPLYAVAMALSVGSVLPRRLEGALWAKDAREARSAPQAPRLDDPDPRTARLAWQAVSAYAAGFFAVAVTAALVALSFGWSNLTRDWRYQMSVAYDMDQLGGAGKGWRIVTGAAEIAVSVPVSLLAGLVLLVLLRSRPRLARVALVLLPLALYFAGRRAETETTGFAVMVTAFAVLAFFFVQPRFAERAARLLVWVVAPAVMAGIWVAFTAVDGLADAAVGLAPAFIAGGLFMVWSAGPEADDPGETLRVPGSMVAGAPSLSPSPGVTPGPSDTPAAIERNRWSLVMASLMGVIAVTIAFTFQYLPQDIPYSHLKVRLEEGPYQGLLVREHDALVLGQLEEDLAQFRAPGERLMVFYGSPGFYLFWPHDIATNTVWLAGDAEDDPLPASTKAWFLRTSEVPDVIVRPFLASGLSDETIEQQYMGGLIGFEVAARRGDYVILRRDPGTTDAMVLNALVEP